MVFSIEGGVTHARDTVNRALAELSRREMALQARVEGNGALAS